MKIDSPTFLTETTFISSSVVFSSGSQKFGNTDDDQHIIIGNLSGSAKTTGSFGAGYIDNKLGIGTTSPADSIDIQQTDSVIRFKNTGASNFEGIELYNPTTGNFVAGYGSYGNTTNGYILDSAGAPVIFNNTQWGFYGRNIKIQNTGASDVGFFYAPNTKKLGLGGEHAPQHTLHISGSGNTDIFVEGNVSGSSTSTGSFARVKSDFINIGGNANKTAGTGRAGLWISGSAGVSIVLDNATGTANRRRVMMDFVSNLWKLQTVNDGGSAQTTHFQVSTYNSLATFTGNVEPGTDNNSNLGSSTKRWANIHSADLHLSNEDTEGNEVDGTTGSWTIQEGEDDLFLLNRKNGKKYRFKLEEIT